MSANSQSTLYGRIPPNSNLKLPKSQKKKVAGLNFPLGSVRNGGYFSKTTGIDMIKDSVRQLLLTETGERVMLPNYGCNLRKYLFEPLDDITFESIRRDIEFSFNNYIKGAYLEKLQVFPSGDSGPSGGNSLQVILSLRLDDSDLEIFDVEVFIQ